MAVPTIALETVADPGSTPIVFNAASSKSFANDYFKVSDLSAIDRKNLRIIALIAQLNAAGGTNYTLNHTGLRQDANVYTGGIPKFDLEFAQAVTDWNSGKAQAATLSTDIPTLLAAGPLFSQQSAEALDRIISFLRIKLQR